MRRNSHDASLGLSFFFFFNALGTVRVASQSENGPELRPLLLPDNGFFTHPIPCSLEKSSHVSKLVNAGFAAVFKLASFAFAAKLNVSALGTFPHGAWSDLCSFCQHLFSLLSYLV